ncbi:hypothetical protein VTN00DRAFT_3954 [Thermoascus crustaceus]|uniref:uncharacterized protein n=1 Tax=Thermoascus crustaceus TaxID=5088 RepID=UPI00374375EF
MEPEKDQIVPVAVDEATWAKYNKQYVLRSLWDPDEYIRQVRAHFSGQIRKWRTETIEQLQHQKSQYYSSSNAEMAESVEKLLQRLEETSPAGPVIPPSESPGLDATVYYRIEILKNTMKNEFWDKPAHRMNIQAVLDAYRSGELKAPHGYVSYWFKGIMVRGPAPDTIDLSEAVPRWVQEYGGGSHYIESVQPPVPQPSYT